MHDIERCPECNEKGKFVKMLGGAIIRECTCGCTYKHSPVGRVNKYNFKL